MHIPDGFLEAKVWVPAAAVSAAGIGACVRRLKNAHEGRLVPLMGVTAAFIFAAQMLNFPVLGGTSGHLLGGVLAAVLLGPAAGALVISVVLIAQCIFFQDGGLTALGANILNMSLVGTVGGWAIYETLRRVMPSNAGTIVSVTFASWASVMMASSACALELAWSGTSPLSVALPAMLFVHAFIGAGEAIITALVVGFLLKVNPALILTREVRYENA